MIPLPGIRDKGGAQLLGARHEGEPGPFGEYDDGQGDGEQHDHNHDDH